jgi:RNA polymerase sigma factor (TIGR02999 family)
MRVPQEEQAGGWPTSIMIEVTGLRSGDDRLHREMDEGRGYACTMHIRMTSDVTQILSAIDSGDPQAAAELLPLVYQELRKLADARLAQEGPGRTLQATDLVHEAYLRLVGPDPHGDKSWDSRGHFFAAAAEAMRRILIDRARARGAVKRGGAARLLRLDPTLLPLDSVSSEVMDLDEALTRFEAEDPQKAALVKLRFFGGLTLYQAAGALGLAPTTADRHWAYARAWLFRALAPDK